MIIEILYQKEIHLAHDLFLMDKMCEKFQRKSSVLVEFQVVLPATRLATQLFDLSLSFIANEINLFYATGLFLYPLKTKNLSFSDVFSGYIKRPVA